MPNEEIITPTGQLNGLWRSLFTEPKYQLLLSSGCLLFVENIIRLLAKVKTIDATDAERSLDALKRARFSDLSETTKVLFWKFAPITGADAEMEQRFARLLFLSRKILDDNHADSDLVARVRYYELSLVEVERLFGVLRHCRNVSAHELRPRTDFGWCLLVPSTILRVLEVCDLPPGSDELTQELRELCVYILTQTIQGHVVGQELAVPSNQPTTEDQLKYALNYLGQIIRRETNGLTGAGNKVFPTPLEEPEASESSDDIDLIDAMESTAVKEAISPEQLRQKLLIIKHQIDESSTEKNDWPGPEANIVQRAIINDVIMHQPRSIEDWIRMPDTAWRYQKHKMFMDQQLEEHWPAIFDLIGSTVWPSDN